MIRRSAITINVNFLILRGFSSRYDFMNQRKLNSNVRNWNELHRMLNLEFLGSFLGWLSSPDVMCISY